ncbi:MvdC/MvdD family ATP grasp protein [Hyalangium versicolor]|uniref:MvdC/MvdD family ATP grasp protein n=1 Tax=Hyalangium versicolor TaxID=2861190 RepID=UPI001CC9A284|nr:MvdC family ATP-grasp ribosomal peptide maturase [Hyalangium versicolor]
MSALRRVVLLLTHSGDYYTVDRVAEELTHRGYHPVRLDTDRFPAEWALATVPGQEGWLKTPAGELREQELQAVWLRRVVLPRFDEALEPAYREACARESLATLEGFLDTLEPSGCRFVNAPGAERLAQNKARQLRLAQALGLEVPRTLITNDASRVRAFFAQVEGRAVTKMLTPLSQSMNGSEPFLYTNELRAEHLDELEGLSYSPMVFQERIPKARELRVSVVGERCFVGAIDTSRSAAGQVDWRRSKPGECPWQAGTVPPEVATQLVRLVAMLGLSYGAVDLIVTPEGRHVFLEVNPGGEWGMLEKELGLPIAAALAEALTAPVHPAAGPRQEIG